MLKCRWLILLDEEVPNPGHAVTGDESEREKPPLANGDEVSNTTERDRSADEVEQTRLRAAVLRNVVWPEFGEGIVSAFRHQKRSDELQFVATHVSDNLKII